MGSKGEVDQFEKNKLTKFLTSRNDLFTSTNIYDRFIEFLINVNLYKSKMYGEFKTFKINPNNADERPGISLEAVRDFANKNKENILKRAPKVFADNKYFVEILLNVFVELCKDQLDIKAQMEANIMTLQDKLKKSDTEEENDTRIESTTNKTIAKAVDTRDTTLSSVIEIFQDNIESKSILVQEQINLQCSLGAMWFTVGELVEIIKGLLAEKMNLDQEKERLQKDLLAKTEENMSINAKLEIVEEKLALQQKENENKQELIKTQQKVSEQQTKMSEYQVKQLEKYDEDLKEREARLKEAEEALKQKQEQFNKANANTSEANNNTRLANQKVEQLKQMATQLVDTNTELNKRIAALEKENAELKKLNCRHK